MTITGRRAPSVPPGPVRRARDGARGAAHRIMLLYIPIVSGSRGQAPARVASTSGTEQDLVNSASCGDHLLGLATALPPGAWRGVRRFATRALRRSRQCCCVAVRRSSRAAEQPSSWSGFVRAATLPPGWPRVHDLTRRAPRRAGMRVTSAAALSGFAGASRSHRHSQQTI